MWSRRGAARDGSPALIPGRTRKRRNGDRQCPACTGNRGCTAFGGLAFERQVDMLDPVAADRIGCPRQTAFETGLAGGRAKIKVIHADDHALGADEGVRCCRQGKRSGDDQRRHDDVRVHASVLLLGHAPWLAGLMLRYHAPAGLPSATSNTPCRPGAVQH